MEKGETQAIASTQNAIAVLKVEEKNRLEIVELHFRIPADYPSSVKLLLYLSYSVFSGAD
jgi:hypothetical protein